LTVALGSLRVTVWLGSVRVTIALGSLRVLRSTVVSGHKMATMVLSRRGLVLLDGNGLVNNLTVLVVNRHVLNLGLSGSLLLAHSST